ncbi:putative mediator of RNA polymerase II transcription subunit 26 isoform X2 [Carica papaya]|nr:putative mediator of RNA polymerase II transcription subunit 26 isoform X2 [Carica papaya]
MESDSGFVEYVRMKANMEKRLGNFVAASNTYKEALELASAKKNLKILPALYIYFSRLIYVELIKFVMIHGGAQQVEMVDSIIAKEISPDPDASHTLVVKDLEDISSLYVQFVDLYGTIHDIRKAWSRHFKLFPQSLMTMYKRSPLCTGPLSITIEGKNETHIASSQQPSGACDINDTVHFPLQDKNLSLPEAEDTQSNDFSASKGSDQKSQLPKNHDLLSDQVTTDLLQSRETESSSHAQVQQVSLEALKQSMEDTIEPNVLSQTPVDRVADEVKTLQTSQDVRENDVQHANDYKSEQDLEPLKLERLSLDSEGDKNIHSVHAESDKWEASQETSMSNGSILTNGQNTMEAHFLSSPRCTRSSDAIEIQTCTHSPSTASPQVGVTEASHRQRSSIQSGRNWHRRNNADKVYRESKSNFSGNSRKKFSQQFHVSQEKQYSRPDNGTQTPAAQVYPNQHIYSENPLGPQGSQELTRQPTSTTHANQAVPPAWSITNMQEHNFSSTPMGQIPSQVVSYPQGQMLQYQLQRNEQQGPMQNNQAYTQMWQYYYYQQQQQQQVLLLQQQQQLQEQQLLQLQPHYVQQEEVQQQQASSQHPQQQPPQRPELEQFKQYDPQLQFEQKQQLLQQHQYTQLQLQQQQQLLQQQQQPYQQHVLYMQQQELQLQHPQYQQLEQQQLVLQQLNPQTMLQQEQQLRSQQPGQQGEEQRQVELQTSKTAVSDMEK